MKALAILALGGAPAIVAGAEPAPSRLAVKAAKVVLSPEKTIPRGVLVIEGGKITAAGTDYGVPRGARVLDLGSATVVAGLVDAHGQSGADSPITDPTEPYTPGLRSADAFPVSKRALGRAAQEGITTVLLAPDGANVIAGSAAVVKTGGPELLALPDSFLQLSFTRAAIRADRYPTALSSALTDWETWWAPSAERRSPALRGRDEKRMEAARKEKRAWIEVDSVSTLRAVLERAKRLGIAPVIVARGDLREAAELAAAKAPVVLGPLDFGSPPALLRQPAELAKAGVEIAFATHSPERGPLALRLTAALAAANGLDRRTALAAVTTHPARWVGLQERIGSIEAGRDADLLATSGDPLDLSSEVRAVIVGGEVVVGPRPPETRP